MKSDSIKRALFSQRSAAILFPLLIAITCYILNSEITGSSGAFSGLEMKFLDENFSRRGPMGFPDSDKVIIVEISQDSYDGIPSPYNTWPWPKSIFARLIRNLNNAGARAIGIDIVMSNPDQFSAGNDSIFMQTVRKYRNIVLAGKADIESSMYSFEDMRDGHRIQIHQPAYRITKQHENYSCLFYDADSSVGIVQVASDNDGVYRRYMPFVKSPSQQRLIPTFAYAILNKYYGLSSTKTAELNDGYFSYAGHKIPRYDSNSQLINFYGADRKFPRVSFLDVIDDSSFTTAEEAELGTGINTWDDKDYGLLNSGIFRDKIVIVGSTLPEDKDILPVSISKEGKKGDNLIYGVEFHANVIGNILENNFLYAEPAIARILILIGLSLISFNLSSAIREIRTKYGILMETGNFLLAALLLFALKYFTEYLFIHHNYVMQLTGPAAAILLSYLSSTTYYYVSERKQKSLIKRMFSRYLSRNVVEELVKDPDKLKLGGEKKELTVFFSDIREFSGFSELLSPEALVEILNEYLSEMSAIILQHNGTLDKFVGDAVMAFWGAPVSFTDHAVLACSAALEMQKHLTVLREKWDMNDPEDFQVRMGINTGQMIVGNVGGSERFDYTVIGDNVNLASRLEGANKIYHTQILITSNTYALVKDRFLIRELDDIVVKGKTKAIQIFELIDRLEVAGKEKLELVENFHKALHLYRSFQFEEALDIFHQLHVQFGDYPSSIYLSRCKFYIDNPPEKEDWDYTIKLTEK